MPSKPLTTKSLPPIYTTMVVLFIIAVAIAIPALILASISFKNSNDLSNDKQDSAPFNTWNTINTTLYKNDIADNVVLLDPVPLLWTQVGKLVYVRLPFLKVD